jgi:hypothetical protein
MAFRFKDLMVEIGPRAEGCWHGSCGVSDFSGNACIACGFIATTATVTEMQPADPAQQLQQLKASLRAALDRVEVREKELQAGEKPQSLAEAEDLERRLEGALAELRQQKQDLQ